MTGDDDAATGDAATGDAATGDAATGDAATQSEFPAPLLRVVRGDPTPEEVAALVSVVAARGAAAAQARSHASRREARSAWGDPALATRGVMRVGPGGWWRSGLPG